MKAIRKTATVNHANEAIDIARTAMDYTLRIQAINYAIKTVEQLHGVRFNQLLTQYINGKFEIVNRSIV